MTTAEIPTAGMKPCPRCNNRPVPAPGELIRDCPRCGGTGWIVTNG